MDVIYKVYLCFMLKSRYSIKCQVDKMGYYKRLRELREDHDFSQRYIAQMLGVTQNQYWLYEKGYRDIPTDLLIKLSEIYNTSVDYMLEISDNFEIT